MFDKCPTCGVPHEVSVDGVKCIDCRLDGVDMLEEMFQRRERFMKHLQSVKNDVPEWPVEITNKDNQLFIKDVIYHAQEELYEALRELKNAKSHRQTEIPDFDRMHFLEEMVDALNLFLEVLVLVGVKPEELLKAYRGKDDVLHRRLNTNY